MKMNNLNEEQYKNHKCSVNCNCSASQKRPMNAFLIFCKRHRSVVKQKYPHLENRSITKILGEWWAKIDLDQKQQYTELARQYKEAFMKANPHFKWYKTDIKLPSNMQPCSPPLYVKSFNNSTSANSSNSFSNCNSTNNNNLETRTQNSFQYSTTHSSSSMVLSDTIHNSSQIDLNDKTNFNNNLTPKPPKKRYLENGEFKEQGTRKTNITNSTNENEQKEIKDKILENKNYTIGGPPVLDIETMNRVIENAFGSDLDTKHSNEHVFYSSNFDDSNCKDSHEFKLFNQTDSRESNSACENNDNEATSNSNRDDKSNDLRCNEKFNEPNEQFDECALEIKQSNIESRSSSPVEDMLGRFFYNLTPTTDSCDKERLKSNSSNKKNEDKPLNLSSTTTVKASQQSLIDNLIDKLLSNGSEGNPMPVEMLQSNSSNEFASNSNKTHQIAYQQRKERSCKGKRYLEMLNENKLSKRSKANANHHVYHHSPISNTHTNTNTNNYNLTNMNNMNNSSNGSNEENNNSTNRTSNNSSSKWVSGGFDLEEHIAALPQLGDNHLISVVDGTKCLTNQQANLKSENICTKQVTTTKELDLNKVSNEDCESNNVRDSTNSTNSNTNTFKIQFEENSHSLNITINEHHLSNSAELAEKIVERLNINSQALECDGLAALAEVALHQAHRISSPSCT